MIALDTNFLVRFLVEDDEEQCCRAASLIQGAIEEDDTLYVSDIVLIELVWVLGRSYRFTREDIISVLRQLLAARHLVFTNNDAAARALDAFERGNGGFSDYLLLEHARAFGCNLVATFDQDLLKESEFIEP